MYKCSECGSEYKEKPNFCDCGNDEFVEIIENSSKETISLQKENKQKTISSNITRPKPQAKQSYPIDRLSLSIFVFCILLSLIVIFFLWNPKETKESKDNATQTVVKNIPSIESFWNNSVPIITPNNEEQTVKQAKTEPIIKQVVSKPTQTKKVSPKTTPIKTTKVKNTTKTPTKVTTNKTTLQQKGIKQIPIPTPKPVTEIKKIEPVTTIQKVPVAKKTENIKVNTPQVNTAVAQKELANYKAALRNTIGKKIDFTQVVGDGDCSVSFKIASNGNLTNRAFSKYSSNVTLNDAVYKALMASPAYNPPPSGYKNETLTLNISIYNGNFQVSIK